MILSTHIKNQITPKRPLGVDLAPGDCLPVNLRTPDHTSCCFEIARVVRNVEAPEVREILDIVFKDLLRLLECLSLIEGHLRQVDAAEETFALFQIIHDEARVLVEFIRKEGLDCSAMSEELRDTLDGITFAVNHDLQRVFETEKREASAETTAHALVGKLYRAHDILTNCLQQSTITLAMLFDPELVGTKLFNNSDMRYRQSLQLCEDLSGLLKLVQASEKNSDGPTFAELGVGTEKFRNESLECLMYSDWPQFESFCERIKLAGASSPELEPVLHQFRCYLETLLGQVRMRAVLANVSPIRVGTDEASSSLQNGENSNLSTDLEEVNPAWDVFQIAV